MKSNRKMFAVRVVLAVVCAVGLLSGVSNAETVHGTFKLPVQTHWGKMVLPPGEYEFVVDTGSAIRLITVHSKDAGWTGMLLATALSEVPVSSGSTMALAKFDGGTYVKTLYLKEARVALEFTMPRATMTKFAKSTSPAMSSASGTH